jgi:translation elongation factor EF-G
VNLRTLPTLFSYNSHARAIITGDKKDLSIKAVQRTVLCMGRRQDAIENVPCGNTVALVRAYFLRAKKGIDAG